MSILWSLVERWLNWLTEMFTRKEVGGGEVQVQVRSGGTSVALALSPHWDVKRVKEAAGSKLGLPPRDLALVLAGKRLSDSTLIKVNISL